MEIKTVITIELRTPIESFNHIKFQEVLDSIKTGEMKREFEKNDDIKLKASCTYWTDYKIKTKQHGTTKTESN
jgi:hypothetical protein